MKAFKFSVLKRRLKLFALTGAITLSVPISLPMSAIAQTTSIEQAQTYLSDLSSFLQEQNMAQSFCQDLASGISTEDAYSAVMTVVISEGPPMPLMPTQEATNVLDDNIQSSVGMVMNMGAHYYCPQYKEQVSQALSNL